MAIKVASDMKIFVVLNTTTHPVTWKELAAPTDADEVLVGRCCLASWGFMVRVLMLFNRTDHAGFGLPWLREGAWPWRIHLYAVRKGAYEEGNGWVNGFHVCSGASRISSSGG